MKCFEQVIKLKPNHYVAWNFKGRTLFYLGDTRGEILSYKKAIEIKIDYQEAWNNLGRALSNLGDWHEGIVSFDKAIKIKPDYSLAYYNKACCYAVQEKVYLAIENLEQAINLGAGKDYRAMAKTDTDFANIQFHPKFQDLINGNSMY